MSKRKEAYSLNTTPEIRAAAGEFLLYAKSLHAKCVATLKESGSKHSDNSIIDIKHNNSSFARILVKNESIKIAFKRGKFIASYEAGMHNTSNILVRETTLKKEIERKTHEFILLEKATLNHETNRLANIPACKLEIVRLLRDGKGFKKMGSVIPESKNNIWGKPLGEGKILFQNYMQNEDNAI